MDDSFENALTKFRASLTEKQRRDFAHCTRNDVEKAIDDIQVRLGSERRLRNMKRIAKFIEAMSELGKVVEVFLNVGNLVAFVWVGGWSLSCHCCAIRVLTKARDRSNSFFW